MPYSLGEEERSVRRQIDIKIDEHLEEFQKAYMEGQESTPSRDEINLAKMLLILSMFNCYISDDRLGLLKKMPKKFEKRYQNPIHDLLVYPEQFLYSGGFFRTVTNELAADIARDVLLQKLVEYSASLEKWNDVYAKDQPLLEMPNEEVSELQSHFREMRKVTHKRVELSSQHATPAIKAKFFSDLTIGTAGLALGLEGVAALAISLSVPGGVAAVLIGAAVAVAAVATVAAISYVWHRHKMKKTYAKLDDFCIKNGLEKREGLKKAKKETKEMEIAARKMTTSPTKVPISKQKEVIPEVTSNGLNIDDIMGILSKGIELFTGGLGSLAPGKSKGK